MTDKKHIGFELRLLHNLIGARMKEAMEADGACLTPVQHWIIRFLEENSDKEIFQKDLEEKFRASRATVSCTLQVMEKNGLIIRCSVKQDARLKCILLTDKAREYSLRIRQNVEQTEQLLRKGMSEAEADELLRLLRLARTNLENYEKGREEKKLC
mgnify:CR=1 FL=1